MEVEEDVVWGMAYRVHTDNIEEVKQYLDYREKNGYSVNHLDIQCLDGTQLRDITVYVGTEDNSEFIGPVAENEIAEQIFRSVGPSGPNVAYLMNLYHALSGFPIPDALDHHLTSLYKRVNLLQNEQSN